ILQDRDQRIVSIKNDLKQIPIDQERAKERLANDNAAVGASKTAIQENEVAIKNIELDIGTRKDTLAKLKVQQFETKKNDEFTAIGNEITRYTEEVDELETSELELMEKADELRAAHEKTQAALALTQGLVDEEIAQLAQRKDEDEARLAEVQQERATLCSDIDEDLLSLYDRLFSSKGGDAVVSADKGQCGGCHMKLVAATKIKVKAAKEVAQCENCGRILHD
ncbi:MAG: zinc ribbon domain-containing protein, partial [Akkermansiaceae bacterium]